MTDTAEAEDQEEVDRLLAELKQVMNPDDFARFRQVVENKNYDTEAARRSW